MKHEYLRFLCCPCCKSDLDLIADQATAHKVLEGTLRCTKCTELFPVRNAIPRFVQNTRYADSFGHQWRAFSRTQLDNEHNRESEIRFTSELGWQEADLHDRLVVEFGSGAGRFIDVVSRKGARLAVGVDATDAVDAAQANLGDRANVFFIQADFFKLPLKAGTFDKVYSIGVLHHTPDPEGAFKLMIETAKVDGAVGLSLYEIVLYHRPPLNSLKGSIKEFLWAANMLRVELFRAVTTRLPNNLFLFYCRYFVPVLHVLNRIPVLGVIRYLLPSTCYKHLPVEWSMLDTFDTYATKIVHQYRHKEIFQWFSRQGMDHIYLHNGRAGWVSLTGIKPADRLQRVRVEYEPRPPGEKGYFSTAPSTPVAAPDSRPRDSD